VLPDRRRAKPSGSDDRYAGLAAPGRSASSAARHPSWRYLRRFAPSRQRNRRQKPLAHHGSARYGKSARNSLSFFSGLGGVFGSIGALFHSAGSLSRSTWYFLPLRLAFISKNVDRKRVATWSSRRRPNGHVPVVSISIELTFGMKISTARRNGIGNPFLFQESSGILSSWNRILLTRGKASKTLE